MSLEAGRRHARPIVVQKYGGSSVADVDRLGRVADKVVATRRAGNDVVVVISAMGKSTDGLLTLARQAAHGDDGPREPPRRELDMLLSTGERVSMSLLSIAIQARGMEAISFTGSQSGILTNDRHFDARIIEVRPHRIEDELARGKIVIVAGFQGMSYKREITTLGRGGSDTTAVALAAALSAERCEIYSDVDGVYSADPRVVADAEHLPELDVDMLQEMAECGAKVVCAQAVEWARRAGIAIYARSTFDVAPAPRQTIVHGEPREVKARAVVVDPRVALVRTSSKPSHDEVLRAVHSAGVTMRDLNMQGTGACFVVPLSNVPSVTALAEGLSQSIPCSQVEDGLAMVSVVGDALTAGGSKLRRFSDELRSVGATARLLTATPLRISGVVAADRADAAQRALHAAFVGSPATSS